MAIDIMNRIWWREDLPMLEKFIGIALADAANETGVCWPAVETIALKCSCSRRSVQNALKGLEGKQLLRRVERKDRSSYYVFNLDNLPQVERPKRLKELGPHEDVFRGAGDAPDLFGTGASGSGRGASGSGRGAAGSGRGAGDAPRTVIEPSEEPSGGETREADEDPKLDDEQIVAMFIVIWNEMAAGLEKVDSVTRIGGNQRKQLLARVSEYASSRRQHAVAELFDKVAKTVAGSLWLRGESGRGDWCASTLWISGKQNFEKIMGGFYVQDAAAAGDRPKPRHERSYADTAERVGAILRARGPAPRQTARELAGLPARGSSGDHR